MREYFHIAEIEKIENNVSYFASHLKMFCSPSKGYKIAWKMLPIWINRIGDYIVFFLSDLHVHWQT